MRREMIKTNIREVPQQRTSNVSEHVIPVEGSRFGAILMRPINLVKDAPKLEDSVS